MASRFCVFWIRKTINEGTIDAIVLIVSCQVSEKWNQGPRRPQITTIMTATMKAQGEPTALAVELANDRKKSFIGDTTNDDDG